MQQLVCGHKPCQFCVRCHEVEECRFAYSLCELAQWEVVRETLQTCGYVVAMQEGCLSAEMGREMVVFVMSSEGLAAAAGWLEVNAVPKLLERLEQSTRLSFWDVVKGVCGSLFSRKVVCEACGQKFQPDDGYYEPGEYSYCKECCHW